MFKKKLILTLIFLIIAFSALSTVNAQDFNNTADATSQGIIDESLELNDGNQEESIIASNNSMDAYETSESDSSINLNNDEDLISENDKINIIPITTTGEYKTGELLFKVTDANYSPLAYKNVSITINRDISAQYSGKTNFDGIASFKFGDLWVYSLEDGQLKASPLSVGKWNVTLKVTDSSLTPTSINIPLNITPATIKLTITNLNLDYESDIPMIITALNKDNEPIKYQNLQIYIPNTLDKYYNFTTNENGTCFIKINKLKPGIYYLAINANDTVNYKTYIEKSATLVIRTPISFKAPKLTTTYKSGKSFQVKVIDYVNEPVSGITLTMKIYTNGKAKTYKITTNSKGIATFKDASKLNPGTHKVVISYSNSKYRCKSVSTSIVVNKKALKITAISKKYTSCGEVHIKVKEGSKPINKIKLNIKVYTGRSYKNYNVLTGYDKKTYKSNGISLISSNVFSVGSHKVKITVVSPYYKGSVISYLKILPINKKYAPYTGVMSNGKLIKYVS
ncbi:hypothetical protein [Methanobrevibacter sp.]|uniref:hypothetical protein n=1 Tax=Methanobrevibacter sp. TaxID=66852 RepID=UPI0026DEF44A|nr:hypothetical protein [Methanobrevibacter sp.]MDO5859612.1 hypothetical protein [Methanobrevibacter sp.]